MKLIKWTCHSSFFNVFFYRHHPHTSSAPAGGWHCKAIFCQNAKMRGKKYCNKESEDLENSNGSLNQNTISVSPESKNQGRSFIILLCICTRILFRDLQHRPLLLATNPAETFQCGSGTQRFSKTLLRKNFQQLLRASSQDVLHQHGLKCLEWERCDDMDLKWDVKSHQERWVRWVNKKKRAQKTWIKFDVELQKHRYP